MVCLNPSLLHDRPGQGAGVGSRRRRGTGARPQAFTCSTYNKCARALMRLNIQPLADVLTAVNHIENGV